MMHLYWSPQPPEEPPYIMMIAPRMTDVSIRLRESQADMWAAEGRRPPQRQSDINA
jgi:hypothetical protein